MREHRSRDWERVQEVNEGRGRSGGNGLGVSWEEKKKQHTYLLLHSRFLALFIHVVTESNHRIEILKNVINKIFFFFSDDKRKGYLYLYP